MAIVARVNSGGNIGQVKLTQQTRSTIAAQNFTPKPNVSVSELSDVNSVGIENGFTLIYNSATGKYDTGPAPVGVLTQIIGGSF